LKKFQAGNLDGTMAATREKTGKRLNGILFPSKFPLVIAFFCDTLLVLFMKTDIHPKYMDAEIRCACGNVIKTRSTKTTVIVGICNVCHPFYTGQQKFVDTAGRVDKFQQRAAKTQAAQEAFATKKKKKA
jgi:large subunit ribosomal protein L31